MIEFVRNYLPTVKGRVITGFIFVGAVTVGIGVDTERPFSVEKLVAILLALATWLIAELDGVGAVSDHDRALYQKITRHLNQEVLTFLREHDYSVPTRIRQIEPISEISYWHGPQYEFNDRMIQRRWLELWGAINSLSDKHGIHLTTMDNMKFLTVWHLGFDRSNQPPQAYEEIKILNHAAHDVYRAFNIFVPSARRRLAL